MASLQIKQTGAGGTEFAQYEKAVLAAPGVIQSLDAASPHPYQNGVWVPWVQQSWGNTSFQYPNGEGARALAIPLAQSTGCRHRVALAAAPLPGLQKRQRSTRATPPSLS